MPPAPLSWRVPTTGDPRVLRLALAHIGLATIVAALVILVAMPRPWLAPALVGLIPLAVLMAFFRWRSFQALLAGPDNFRITNTGVHWLDHQGHEHVFPRQLVTSFRVGPEADTLRPVPALTLYLEGGFESQPIELHEPATPEAVRSLLTGQWELAEDRGRSSLNGQAAGAYDLAVDVYSECHDEFQEWHWEGSRGELGRLFEQAAAAAGDPLPPTGAKPLQRVILAQRRHATRLALAHSPVAHFDHDTIAAPASVLRTLASRAREVLSAIADGADGKFDVPLGSRNVWTFHLHLRSG